MRSLSEIETAVKRASRAIGFSWGDSEEIGKSIRLLELFGLHGIKSLNQYYKERESKNFESLSLINEKNEPSSGSFFLKSLTLYSKMTEKLLDKRYL